MAPKAEGYDLPAFRLGKTIYSGYHLKVSLHARLKLDARQMTVEEVIRDLSGTALDPLVVQQGKDKFCLYYKVTRNVCHKYVLEKNEYEKALKLITVEKIRVDWQRMVSKHV